MFTLVGMPHSSSGDNPAVRHFDQRNFPAWLFPRCSSSIFDALRGGENGTAFSWHIRPPVVHVKECVAS